MTVATQSNLITYIGDGAATVFPFYFPVYDAAHIEVRRYNIATGDYTLLSPSGFTVTGVGNENGGSVTIGGTPVPATDKVIIARIVPLTQDLDLLNQGGFYPENVETEFDLEEMQIQQLDEELDRAIRYPIGEALEPIPAAPYRISKLLGFGPIGELRLASVGDLAKGDPGGNVMAIGLFDDAHTLSIPLGTDIVRTSGFALLGKGAAFYMADAAVDAAYVVANPLTSFISSNARGFRYVFTGTVDLDAFGADPSGSADSTVNIQAALDYLNAHGGGICQGQIGTYKVTAWLRVYPKTIIRGCGRSVTKFTSAHIGGSGANASENLRNGSVFRSVFPINSSTAAAIKLEEFTIENTNNSNIGAGYYDTGGTFIYAHNVKFIGFKFGVVLEQSELVHFDTCEFSAQHTAGGAGAYLVNGNLLTAAAGSEYTNVITFSRCQFNEPGTVYCVLDTGGDNHTYDRTNFNGGLNALRTSGLAMVNWFSNQCESQAGPCIDMQLSDPSSIIDGGAVLAVHAGIFSATAGNPSINCNVGAGSLSIDGGAWFSGGGSELALVGLENLSSFNMTHALNSTGELTLYDHDLRATQHFDSSLHELVSGEAAPGTTIGDHVSLSWEGTYGWLTSRQIGGFYQPLRIQAKSIDFYQDGTKIIEMALDLGVSSFINMTPDCEFRIGGVKVLGAQQAAIAHATDAASAITQQNLIIDALRAHGLIDT
jgi:hypothetical protein